MIERKQCSREEGSAYTVLKVEDMYRAVEVLKNAPVPAKLSLTSDVYDYFKELGWNLDDIIRIDISNSIKGEW